MNETMKTVNVQWPRQWTMKWDRLRLPQLMVGVLVLLLVGCAPRYQRDTPPSGTNSPARSSSAKMHDGVDGAMRAAVESLLVSEPLQASPVTLVQPIANNTGVYFPTPRYSKQLQTGLIESGRITPVPDARVQAVRASLGLAANQVLVDPATIVRYGRMLGAQYQLSGKITGQAPYQLSLQLMDLQSGVIAWQDVERFVSR
jgi:Collagen-binding surface adhesin SpaP (antigen I/II family)